MAETTPLTADEFFMGLFSALATRGRPAISIRSDRFDRILSRVFEELESTAGEESVDLRFRIRPHPIHGDSPTVRAALSAAAQADLISLENPEYQDIRFKIGSDDADFYFQMLPVRRAVFEKLADVFFDEYDSPTLAA
jgi:hypothetical protein